MHVEQHVRYICIRDVSRCRMYHISVIRVSESVSHCAALGHVEQAYRRCITYVSRLADTWDGGMIRSRSVDTFVILLIHL